MSPSLTSERGRSEILRRYFDTLRALERLELLLATTEGPGAAPLADAASELTASSSALIDRYRDGLHQVVVSRSPISNETVEMPIDTEGLDGLWWDYDAPVRPHWTRPKTLIGLTGSIRLGEPPAWTPFLCKPGPDAPYVLPRLMAPPEVIAVLSSLKVGSHTAWVTAYYADPWPDRLAPPNDWGARETVVTGTDGRTGWVSYAGDEGNEDFDLESWLRTGRLRWIEPNDKSWTIQRGVGECPYVHTAGRREPQRIQEGVVW